jgi:peptidyl-prolyl cis-trans isomerase-like 4
MANSGKVNSNKSQFFITLGNEALPHLDGKHSIFGEVAEGFEVLNTINTLFCDEDGRPFQDIRIRHTYILDDPFPDPDGWKEPPGSPTMDRPPEEKISLRIPYEENLDEGTDSKTAQELEESIRRKEAQSRAVVLEMTGDIPDADIKPPAEVLFVCKLNPVTTDADLEIIFSRFGRIKECEVIRDQKTGDSLNYA